MTYEEMCAYCRAHRESDGFCRRSSSCSGPSPSNLISDYPAPKGVRVYRGGVYGSCRFEVVEP